MEYRDIIKECIEDLLKKKESIKSEKEKARINRTISCLLADLQEYENLKHWKRQSSIPSIDEIINKFSKDLFDMYE